MRENSYPQHTLTNGQHANTRENTLQHTIDDENRTLNQTPAMIIAE